MPGTGEAAWRSYEREGFDPLERFIATVRTANWQDGKNDTKQLQLVLDVEAIELPVEHADVKETKAWYSIGKKSTWQIINDGKDLWSPDERAGFVKTSKFWKLVERSWEIKAGVDMRGDVTDSSVWVGLRAIWVRETIEYQGLDPSDIVLPVQVLGTGAASAVPSPAPQMMAPPAASAVPTPVPAPQAAPPPAPASAPAPPPAPSAPSSPPIDYSVVFNANWLKFVQGTVKDKPVITAATELVRNQSVSQYTDLTNAINSPEYDLLAWMVDTDWLKIDNGIYRMP